MSYSIVRDKALYRQICETQDIPLFSQAWWLDEVCTPEQWEVLVLLREKSVIATMPIYRPYKGAIFMPPYAATMGIWIRRVDEAISAEAALSREHHIMELLIDSLPNVRYFSQRFAPAITNWLPFYWKGYLQTTRYTYQMVLPNDRSSVLLQMRKRMRNDIINAQERHHIAVRTDISADDAIRLIAMSMSRQGLSLKHPKVLRRIITSSIDRRQGRLYGAYLPTGELICASFIAWSHHTAWLIASGADPNYRAFAPQALVRWRSILELPSEITLVDFEGSMIKGVERSYRSFGGIQTPYFEISKGRLTIAHRLFGRLSQKIKHRG